MTRMLQLTMMTTTRRMTIIVTTVLTLTLAMLGDPSNSDSSPRQPESVCPSHGECPN